MKLVRFCLAVSMLAITHTEPGLSTKLKHTVKSIKKTINRQTKERHQAKRRFPASRTTLILETLLQKENYDKRSRPDEGERTARVGVNLYFNTLSSLDEENMEFDMDVYLRQTWTDKRLDFTQLNNISRSDTFILIDPPDQVWTPDIYLENSKHASFHMVTKKNELLRLWPNGSLYYSVRQVYLEVTAKVSCFMVLYRFPVDVQKCLVKLGSYKYSLDDLSLYWTSWGNDPFVLISPSVKLARYTISGMETKRQIVNYGIGGKFSNLVVDVSFKRDVGHYILQQYMPCSYVVLLSWVCFWIAADCVGDRISIGVTLVLTIVLLQGSLNTNMPKVSYSKYIDYYFNFCLGFLMMSIIESLVVYKCHKMEVKNTTKVLEPRISSQSLFLMRTRKENWNWESLDDRRPLHLHPSVKSVAGTGTTHDTRMSQKIDKMSRMFFPLSFMVFNILYHFYFNLV